jgi:hypothetical protein
MTQYFPIAVHSSMVSVLMVNGAEMVTLVSDDGLIQIFRSCVPKQARTSPPGALASGVLASGVPASGSAGSAAGANSAMDWQPVIATSAMASA